MITRFINNVRYNWEIKSLVQKRSEWVSSGATLPPPHSVKRLAVLECSRGNHGTFVETGTYMGEMTEAMGKFFSCVHTLELSPEIHAKTSARLKHLSHLNFHQGDSGKLLGEVINAISTPITFWLDGHYSGGITAQGEKDTPIWQELAHILAHQNRASHVILIDDARCFTASGEFGDYPTIEELTQWVSKNLQTHTVNVKDDIIRIVPSL